jgi:hypothetical protein
MYLNKGLLTKLLLPKLRQKKVRIRDVFKTDPVLGPHVESLSSDLLDMMALLYCKTKENYLMSICDARNYFIEYTFQLIRKRDKNSSAAIPDGYENILKQLRSLRIAASDKIAIDELKGRLRDNNPTNDNERFFFNAVIEFIRNKQEQNIIDASVQQIQQALDIVITTKHFHQSSIRLVLDDDGECSLSDMERSVVDSMKTARDEYLMSVEVSEEDRMLFGALAELNDGLRELSEHRELLERHEIPILVQMMELINQICAEDIEGLGCNFASSRLIDAFVYLYIRLQQEYNDALQAQQEGTPLTEEQQHLLDNQELITHILNMGRYIYSAQGGYSAVEYQSDNHTEMIPWRFGFTNTNGETTMMSMVDVKSIEFFDSMQHGFIANNPVHRVIRDQFASNLFHMRGSLKDFARTYRDCPNLHPSHLVMALLGEAAVVRNIPDTNDRRLRSVLDTNSDMSLTSVPDANADERLVPRSIFDIFCIVDILNFQVVEDVADAASKQPSVTSPILQKRAVLYTVSSNIQQGSRTPEGWVRLTARTQREHDDSKPNLFLAQSVLKENSSIMSRDVMIQEMFLQNRFCDHSVKIVVLVVIEFDSEGCAVKKNKSCNLDEFKEECQRLLLQRLTEQRKERYGWRYSLVNAIAHFLSLFVTPKISKQLTDHLETDAAQWNTEHKMISSQSRLLQDSEDAIELQQIGQERMPTAV